MTKTTPELAPPLQTSSPQQGEGLWPATYDLMCNRIFSWFGFRSRNSPAPKRTPYRKRQPIAKGSNVFENGRIDVNGAYCDGRPPTLTNAETVDRVRECILANTSVTVDEIANELDISHRSAHNIIVEHLGFSKACAEPNGCNPTMVTGREYSSEEIEKLMPHFYDCIKKGGDYFKM
ncbi:hypothetical protein AVEN_128646-1 [Araneus ventricosus]|uniref:Uncharacterized protein n=1 Tax=Araneus ventricosus TaxID=182803 RepID=A0A4Y2PQY0_ARAVE|nr:hypothetical protein AVEN_248602-1 [Araneus ventricosus]GBN54305.1 hypothetical protein AVEN_128646-1 [Araneus ventricosus]